LRTLAVPRAVHGAPAPQPRHRLASRIASLLRVGIVASILATVGVLAPAAPTGTNATPPSAVVPVASAAIRNDIRVGMALNASVHVTFSTPMNPRSVEGSVRVVPAANVALAWDTSASVLTVTPVAGWEPTTIYTVTVDAGALAASGAPMSRPARAAFMTRAATSARIELTKTTGGRAAPDTAFSITFDGAVDGATVAAAVRLEPAVEGSIVQTGRRGAARYVFTPSTPLAANTSYRLVVDGVTDAGASLIAPASLDVRVAGGPDVVRFRPRDGTTDVAPSVDVSVRFTERMDRTSTQAAISVTAAGRRVQGTMHFAEDDTVVVFHPASAFRAGQAVVMTVAASARSASGATLGSPVSGRFTVGDGSATQATTAIPRGGSVGAGTWAAVETYYLALMNCTRTGGWVTSSGSCSSPGGRAVAPLWIEAGISSKVSRPYAKLLATRNLCNHFIGGTPGDRLRLAGYTSYIWAENLGCRSGDPYSAVLGSHLYFQAEKSYLGGHYVNLMNAKYDRVGIGVWVASGRVRLVVDFYHPR
jgi:hypothetical protein